MEPDLNPKLYHLPRRKYGGCRKDRVPGNGGQQSTTGGAEIRNIFVFSLLRHLAIDAANRNVVRFRQPGVLSFETIQSGLMNSIDWLTGEYGKIWLLHLVLERGLLVSREHKLGWLWKGWKHVYPSSWRFVGSVANCSWTLHSEAILGKVSSQVQLFCLCVHFWVKSLW